MSSNNVSKSNSFIATIGFDRDLTLKIQSTNMGSIALTPAQMPARYSNIPFPGDKLDFSDLNIQFLLDEDFHEWVVLNKWMFEISDNGYTEDGEEKLSFVEISVLDRNSEPSIRVVYHNAHPISIGDIEMSIIDDEQTLTCIANFVYSHYTIKNVKTGETIEYGSE